MRMHVLLAVRQTKKDDSSCSCIHVGFYCIQYILGQERLNTSSSKKYCKTKCCIPFKIVVRSMVPHSGGRGEEGGEGLTIFEG